MKYHESVSIRPMILNFCKLLCCKPPLTLEVLLTPQGLEDEHTECCPDRIESELPKFHTLEELMEPFRVLRNVKRFAFEDAKAKDLSTKYNTREPRTARDLPSRIAPDLKLLVEGSKEIEHGFLMHQKVVAYAQAFERHPMLRSEMDTDSCTATENILDRIAASYGEKVRNCFKDPHCHPVEAAIELSCLAAEKNDVDEVKEHRKVNLEFLEPQYQRIMAASTALCEFIKDQKTPRGILGYDAAGSKKLRGVNGHVDVSTQCYAHGYASRPSYGM